MNRRFGNLFTALLVLGFVGLTILMGCDKSLLGDSVFSPRADVKIVDLGLPTGEMVAPFIGVLEGTENQTSTRGYVDYPDLNMKIADYNGVTVSYSRYTVEYFNADGVTPANVAPLTGFLCLTQQGGYPTYGDMNTLSVNVDEPTTGVGLPGITTYAYVKVPGVSRQLKELMIGTGDEPTPIRRDELIVGVITIFGEDINSNDIQISARFTVTSKIPVVTYQG